MISIILTVSTLHVLSVLGLHIATIEAMTKFTLGMNCMNLFLKFWLTISISFQVSLEIAVFVVPYICSSSEEKHCGISPVSIIVYTHATWWFLYMLIDRYKRCQHTSSRLCGYLSLYMKTRNIRRIPILIFSGGRCN